MENACVDAIDKYVRETVQRNLVGYIGREMGSVVRAEIAGDVMDVYYQYIRPLQYIEFNVTVTV